MKIRIAKEEDLAVLKEHDRHVSEVELTSSVILERIYIAEEEGSFAGWLRYNMFWDNTPFMNMLYVLEEYRLQGFGRALVHFWENEMAQKGHKTLLTSTQQDEYAQHFYVNRGYSAIGGFSMPGEAYEIIMQKTL